MEEPSSGSVRKSAGKCLYAVAAGQRTVSAAEADDGFQTRRKRPGADHQLARNGLGKRVPIIGRGRHDERDQAGFDGGRHRLTQVLDFVDDVHSVAVVEQVTLQTPRQFDVAGRQADGERTVAAGGAALGVGDAPSRADRSRDCRIMPAPRVSLVIGSIRMKLPVARLRR